ncbi:LysM peptidoglycan-binding domain-containing protein [Sutcliffiella horikoshii]|uniref:LysM peptidoglycan-binding domain-containing protein n=1 Tax=Sutcliffiella horikoshii TaxID=79883 RepID=UPI001CBC4735|nr:LysM peptidoglycan-binding domain-containing protein [Sutcliffiella horikoshii]UAL45801.1 LysM peptidoglycan-binding domain-containing protein [Sutcliffiella horikoshii]
MENNKGLDQADGLREEVEKESNKLPSRSELHAQKRSKKTKWKVNFPFVRLIGVLFLLIPISIMAIHFNNQETNFLDKMFTPAVKNVEQISIPKNVSASTVDKADKNDEETPVAAEQMSTRDNEAEEVTDQGNETADGPGKTAEKEESKSTTEQSDSAPASQPETEEVDVTEEEVEEESSNVTYIEHIVQESETLYRISMKYFSSRDGERIISDHNNLVNGQVNVGQKLLIPVNR